MNHNLSSPTHSSSSNIMSFHAGISTSASSQPSAANSISTSAGITVNSNISNSASGNTKNSTLEIPKGSIKRVMKLNQEVPNISAVSLSLS